MDPLHPYPYRAPSELGSLPDDARAYNNSAGRLSRLGAAVIDVIIGAVLVLPIQYYAGVYEDFPNGKHLEFPGSLIWSLLGAAIWLAVNGQLLARSGQTVGKRLLGIQIVNVSDGKPASFSKLVLWRALPTMLVPQLPYLGGLLGFLDIMFIFRNDRRCLHDHLAGTRVVEVRS